MSLCFLAVQSLSKQSDLEAMVKTLAPVLLAELVNLKSSAASSSSKTEKTSSHKSSKATSSGTSSSTKPAVGFVKQIWPLLKKIC